MTTNEQLLHDLAGLSEGCRDERLLRLGSSPLPPGPSAFPAVTILAAASTSGLRGTIRSEEWTSGDLIALTGPPGGAQEGRSADDRVYFMALGKMAVHPLDIVPGGDSDPTSCSLRVQPHERWDDCAVQFALLPWRRDDPGRSALHRSLADVGRHLAILGRELAVTAELDGETVPVQPSWGLAHAPFRPELEGIRLPLTRSAAAVEGFILRLRLGPRMGFGGGARVLSGESISLRFHLPTKALESIWARTGIHANGDDGFSVRPNALPLAQVDLKAWLKDQAYDEFVRQADAKPLGCAGVFPYAHAPRNPRLASANGGRIVLSMNVDPQGDVLRRYTVVGEPESPDSQLLFWVSQGPERNGQWFSYRSAQPRQPLERASSAFAGGACIVPAYSGAAIAPSETPGSAFGLRASLAPQMFAFRDGLVGEALDILRLFGYEHAEIDGPVFEARILEGARRRAVVLYCRNPGGHRITTPHLGVLWNVLAQRVPPGMDVLVEERSDERADH